MKLTEIESLFQRIRRLSNSLKIKNGPGISWHYTFPDGQTQTYRFKNIRPPEEIEDDIANMFIWTWSLKDYLKELARSKGLKPKLVEDAVNENDILTICGDLANLLKHGELKNGSRSGIFPKLLKPEYEIPQDAIESMTFEESTVTTVVSKPELVQIFVTVQDQHNQSLGDAHLFLTIAVTKWEEIYEHILNS